MFLKSLKNESSLKKMNHFNRLSPHFMIKQPNLSYNRLLKLRNY